MYENLLFRFTCSVNITKICMRRFIAAFRTHHQLHHLPIPSKRTPYAFPSSLPPPPHPQTKLTPLPARADDTTHPLIHLSFSFKTMLTTITHKPAHPPTHPPTQISAQFWISDWYCSY